MKDAPLQWWFRGIGVPGQPYLDTIAVDVLTGEVKPAMMGPDQRVSSALKVLKAQSTSACAVETS